MGHPGYLDRETGCKGNIAADVDGLLTDLGETPDHNVVNRVSRNSRTIDYGGDHLGKQIDGMKVRERPSGFATAGGRMQSVDDDDRLAVHRFTVLDLRRDVALVDRTVDHR